MWWLMVCRYSSRTSMNTLAQVKVNMLVRGRQPKSTTTNESRCIEMLAQRAGKRWGRTEAGRSISTHWLKMYLYTLAQDVATRAATQVHESSTQ